MGICVPSMIIDCGQLNIIFKFISQWLYCPHFPLMVFSRASNILLHVTRYQIRQYGLEDSQCVVILIVQNFISKIMCFCSCWCIADHHNTVKPHPPVDLTVTCDAFAPQNCTILWQDPQETQCFRLRYQPIHSNSWITVGTLK